MNEFSPAYRVTAIVSVFKAQRFLRACLEDLVRQTIFDATEIIIIDACSPEDEQSIAAEFTAQYPNIHYVRTPERETLYASWNRAIGMAHGRYLTNANADDRHAPECYERLASTLDSHPEAGMAYAQCRVTDQENAFFETAPLTRILRWLPYDHLNLIRRCEVGPQPMWRADVHAQVGLFDESLTVSGDHDMWLRISERWPLIYVPEELGLYLEYGDNLETRNRQSSFDEDWRVKEAALHRFMHPDFRPHVPFSVQMRVHAAELTRMLEELRSGKSVPDVNTLEFHAYAYAALAARGGDVAAALEVVDMCLTLEGNSKNLCHLYRFFLRTSPGERAGITRVEPGGAEAPLVSVVVPLYNQGHFLEEAVTSVLAQTETRWEMCIVNDGSTDNSLRAAKDILVRYDDVRIKLVSQANNGKGKTRNRGVRETSAPFVCVLDADDMLVPTYFSTALYMLAQHEDAGWVCPRSLVFGGNNHVTWTEEYNFYRSLLQCPCPVTALYRRVLWVELGGYVEDMTDREDWEFWVRAGEAGWTGLTTPRVEFVYRHAFTRFGEQPRNNVRSKMEYMQRHAWWFKSMGKDERLAMLSAYSVGILPEVVLRPEAVESTRPHWGRRDAFRQAVEQLKTREQKNRGEDMSVKKNSPADAAVLSFTDIDHVRRTLVHGSLDISPLAALESRQNIFTTPDFCAPLYGLRHPDLLPHNAYMSFVRYASHTGTLDQGRLCLLDAQDITLYREAELPRCTQEQGALQRVLIATSIAPKRIGDQQRAIATWTVQGFGVISVNYHEEIEQLQQYFPHIRFVPAQRDSQAEIGKRRVYIDDILNALYAHGQDAAVLGIVNADVGLYRMTPGTLCQACAPGHILISHRVNLPSKKPHVVGYDAFFFPARPVGDTVALHRYLLGEPWWDYALPLFFMRHGCKLLQASPPCCFHPEHSEHWSQESWQRLGAIFVEDFQHTLGKGPLCSIPYTFADVFRHPLTPHSLGFFSTLFVYMAKKAVTCNLLWNPPYREPPF